jgi:mono/diheme cytochrome c family protein
MNLKQVKAITRNGQGGMPGFSDQLTTEEINAVSAFVLTLGDGQSPVTTTTTLPPGTPSGSGAALYRQHCSGCHGAKADGGIGGPLVGSPLSFSQQISVTSHGRGTMPAFKAVLTTGEIDSIIRYIGGLGGSGTTVTTTLPPEGESGAAIFSRLCTACHGAGGSGGSGGSVVGTAFHGSALADVITSGIGTMPAFGNQLDSTQLSRLVSYVEGLGGGNPGDGSSGSPSDGALGSPLDGFDGHASENGVPSGGRSSDESLAAFGGETESTSPLPVGNPVGWMLALAITAALILSGSTLTGAMPKEAESNTGGGGSGPTHYDSLKS